MGKLYFRYGAMGCSKTANALMVAFNYEEKGLSPLLLKPKLEHRDGENLIKSRIGLSRECGFVEDYIFPLNHSCTLDCLQGFDCLIIDEVQFCREEEVEEFLRIVEDLKIPVICYGLLTDFQNQCFPASEKLLVLADRNEELKTVCWCGQGAKCNARLDGNGVVLKTGKQIQFGGNESYVSLCIKHYNAGDIGPHLRKLFATS